MLSSAHSREYTRVNKKDIYLRFYMSKSFELEALSQSSSNRVNDDGLSSIERIEICKDTREVNNSVWVSV